MNHWPTLFYQIAIIVLFLDTLSTFDALYYFAWYSIVEEIADFRGLFIINIFIFKTFSTCHPKWTSADNIFTAFISFLSSYKGLYFVRLIYLEVYDHKLVASLISKIVKVFFRRKWIIIRVLLFSLAGCTLLLFCFSVAVSLLICLNYNLSLILSVSLQTNPIKNAV